MKTIKSPPPKSHLCIYYFYTVIYKNTLLPLNIKKFLLHDIELNESDCKLTAANDHVCCGKCVFSVRFNSHNNLNLPYFVSVITRFVF